MVYMSDLLAIRLILHNQVFILAVNVNQNLARQVTVPSSLLF